jgi:hypothetical protein
MSFSWVQAQGRGHFLARRTASGQEIVMNATVSRSSTTPDHSAAPVRQSDAGGASRRANYLLDVALIALMAAPFLIFEAPTSIQDAVVSAAAERPAVMSTARAAVPLHAAAVTNNDVYGPE